MANEFKSEEELKQFIENLGTEYRFSCFKEKNSEGCHLLGDYLEAIQKDFEGAAKVYKSNCDERNYARSCFKYGNYCYLGKGIEKDVLSAFNYYKKACSLDSAEACLHCGVMLTTKDKSAKDIITRDYVEGLKYLEKSCAGGNATACYFASSLYITGAEGIPKNRTKASELSRLACDGRNVYACMNLSQMYREGDGVEKDEEKANLYKERAREIRGDLRKKHSLGLQQFT
ncbi:Sel1 repeat-containing protein 1-like protein, partial [Stegodyphus mimosarum]